MTPRLFDKYVDAYNNKQRATDAHNHRLGQYIGIATNNSKEYPKEPFLAEIKQPETKEMPDTQMQDEAKRIAIMFGGEIK